jgi:hypothetical protein
MGAARLLPAKADAAIPAANYSGFHMNEKT